MARRIRSPLANKTKRAALAVRSWPYFTQIRRDLHLGYRKGKRGAVWVARSYLDGVYRTETIGPADDTADGDGQTVFSFDQAQARAEEIHSGHKRAGPEARGQGKHTVAQVMADYIAWLKDHGKGADDAQLRSDALILPALGKIDASKLTTRQLNDWLRDIATSPARTRGGKKKELDLDDAEALRRRKATANRTRTILVAALNHAFNEGLISSDNAWRKFKPFKDVDAARQRYLTIAEAKRLVNACPAHFRQLVQGALATGARYSELAALDAGDYDPAAGTAMVRRSKTGKPRHIILADEGKLLFDGLTAGRPKNAPIFPRPDGGRWGRSHQDRPMRDACTNAKITPPVGFHNLRHTYASLSIMGGGPFLVVARNLGHADTRMCKRHYGHLADKYLTETIQRTAPKFGFKVTNVARLDAANA